MANFREIVGQKFIELDAKMIGRSTIGEAKLIRIAVDSTVWTVLSEMSIVLP